MDMDFGTLILNRGNLFVSRKGFLAFVWRESKAVLTLQRMDLQTLLKNGERVAALPPIANFAYLTKSYSNVFAGYSGLPSVSLTRSKSTLACSSISYNGTTNCYYLFQEIMDIDIFLILVLSSTMNKFQVVIGKISCCSHSIIF